MGDNIQKEDWIEEKRKRFGELLSKVEYPKPGTYKIEVGEVLELGSYYVMPPEVVVVEDIDGKLWAIPEDGHCDDLPRLVSRYDVKKGTKLQVVVAKEDGERHITEVIILAR